MTKTATRGRLLRLYFGESDRFEGRALHEVLVERLRQEGIAGVTVFRGILGFGAESHLQTSHLLHRHEDLPMILEVADSAENIERILPIADSMVTEGLITIEDVDLVAFRRAPTGT